MAGPHNSSGSNNRSLSRWSAPLPRASLCSFCLFCLFFILFGLFVSRILSGFFFFLQLFEVTLHQGILQSDSSAVTT